MLVCLAASFDNLPRQSLTELLPRQRRGATAFQASKRLRVGMIGAGERIMSLTESFSANPAAEVVAIADLDANRLRKVFRKPRGSRQRGLAVKAISTV